MRYKILKRIQNGQSTVGFQVLSEDGKTLNVTKNQVIQAAYQGLVINATYNKHTKSLSGAAGTDLRSLPVVKQSELNTKNTRRNKNTTDDKVKNNKNIHESSSDAAKNLVLRMIDRASKEEAEKGPNHKLAKNYLSKQKESGLPELRLRFLDNDRVELIQVLDTESTGTFIMPSFITDHKVFEDSYGFPYCGPFVSCKFREIVIDHSYTNWKYLFSGLESDSISIKYSGNLVKDLKSAFYKCKKAKTIDLNELDTIQATDMSGMFYGCESLLSIDLSNFDTSHVMDMSRMFSGCKSLGHLDLSNFDTSHVKDMCEMFNGCNSLVYMGISHFDTSNVSNMDSMFNGCKSLENLDISKFNTSNVYSMDSMFRGCKSLTYLDISRLDTRNISSMYHMFSGCELIKSLDISSLNTSKVHSMSDLFHGCKSLESLDISGLDTSRVIDMSGMFEGCEALKYIDFSKLDIGILDNMARMFYGCKSLEYIDISNFNTDYNCIGNLVVLINDMFSECPALGLVICRENGLDRLKTEYLRGNTGGKAEFRVYRDRQT